MVVAWIVVALALVAFELHHLAFFALFGALGALAAAIVAVAAPNAVGLQLLAPWGQEARLLDAAEQLERATRRRWADAVPPIDHDDADVRVVNQRINEGHPRCARADDDIVRLQRLWHESIVSGTTSCCKDRWWAGRSFRQP